MFGDNSSDLEDLREDYKSKLIALHATLKKLDRDMDFSAILNPLLAETGPAVTHVQRLAKQIVRMKKYIKENEEKLQADFLRQSPAQTSGGSGCSAAAAKVQADFLRQSPAQNLAVQQQQQLRLQLLGRVQPAMGLHAAAAAGGAHLHLPEALFQRKLHQLGGN